jgi:hypothetical protein
MLRWHAARRAKNERGRFKDRPLLHFWSTLGFHLSGLGVYQACANQVIVRILNQRYNPGMGVNISNEMSAITDFQRWLWSDWGTPNFLTRMGIPRVVTNFLSFVLGFIALYYLTLRYAAPGDRERIRLFVHNPFVLAAYAALYVAILSREFASSKYKVKGKALDKVMRENWSEPSVKVSMYALASMLLLFLVGCVLYRFQLK